MIDSAKTLAIIAAIHDKMQQEKDFLTELDNVIGDGDHGINLARGFREVMAKLPTMEGKDIGAILKAVGMTLLSTVGGASGPLYGTAFMKMGAAMADKTEVGGADLEVMLKEAIGGIQLRGKAQTGEKTMLDALIPAYETYQAQLAAGSDGVFALEKAVEAARAGVEYTKTIIATKGRASYLGERSIGYQDPGATSLTMMLEVLLAALA